MKLELKKMKVLGAFILGALSLSSCLNNDDELPPLRDLGYVAFYNVSPDSNGLNFYADDIVVNTSPVGYSQFVNYVGIDVGTTTLTVGSSNAVLDTLNLNLATNRLYSVFATNQFENLELTAYEDAISTPASGKIMMRFIHLAPDAPQLTVKVEGSENAIGNFNYKQANSFAETNSIINKNVYIINTETQDTLSSKQVNLTSGRIYTILALGLIETENENQKLKIETVGFNY